MKTTEQAAKEKYSQDSFYVKDEKMIDIGKVEAFTDCKAFAEEWISFQNELPPFSKDKILLKREKPNSETIYELRRFNTGNKAHILALYTHWRPISKK